MMCLFGKFKIDCAVLVLFVMSGLAALLPVAASATSSVTFGWEPSADPGVVGYNIYYGTVSQVYTNKLSVGNMTTATISDLVEGQTYYFAATTYDVLNQESVFSDEIAYAVPLPDTNQPPVMTEIPTTSMAAVGQSFTCKITATDEGPLSYSLGAGAPTGAWIDPNTGLFAWKPQIGQASTTNVIPVIVTDNGSPAMSTTKTFTVVVLDYVRISIGSAVVATNSAGGVALAVYASAPLTNLQFILDYPPDQLTDFSISGANSVAASVTSIAPGQVLIAITADVEQPIIGGQALGTIEFQSVATSKTEFASLETDQPLARKTDGALASYTTADQGRVTIVGQESMVEARLDNGVRSLIVYGPIGTSYQIESCNVLGNSGVWVGAMDPFTMTSLAQTIQLPPDTNSATFYRTRQTQ